MTNTTYEIKRNCDSNRNADAPFKLFTRQNGEPHGVVPGDFKTLTLMGETFARTGLYYLLPFSV